MKRFMSIGLILISALCVCSCSEDDHQTVTQPDELEPECVLSIYASSGKDVIYKTCNYIEKCDTSIYNLYSSSKYPKGLIDECYCNRYLNEILDSNGSESEAANAYQDLATLNDDPLAGVCSSNMTGIVQAKLKKFFD